MRRLPVSRSLLLAAVGSSVLAGAGAAAAQSTQTPTQVDDIIVTGAPYGVSQRAAVIATDVLDEEPPKADHPLLKLPNAIVTPHIGSRTAESVQRQAVAAVTNLIRAMRGEKPLAQVNPEVPVQKVV